MRSRRTDIAVLAGFTALALTAGCATAPEPVLAPAAPVPAAPAAALPAAPLQVLPAAVTPVKKPVWVRRIDPGQTGWFSSPALVDLDGDGSKEIVAPLYSTYVYSATGAKLATGTATSGRVYAPSVVADLDGDGVTEIVVGGSGTVGAYEWRNGQLVTKQGWPASVASGGQKPEVRGLAAADLDGNGTIEVVATTTNTSPTGAQVFVFAANGTLYQPSGGHSPAWPRYNQLTGNRQRQGLQRPGQRRLRRVRAERRHRPARRRPAARDRGHLRQPPDQPVQPRRHLGARLRLVHQPGQRLRRAAARLGPVHPLAVAGGRGRPVARAHRHLAESEEDVLAAVDGVAAIHR